jgi:hypothetical protein
MKLFLTSGADILLITDDAKKSESMHSLSFCSQVSILYICNADIKRNLI